MNISVPVDKANDLPEDFVQIVARRNGVHCSTFALQSLSDRALESMIQALSSTNRVLGELFEVMRAEFSALFSFVDSVVSVLI